MFESDRTHISAAISVLYVCASLHCLWRTIVISREADAGRRAASQIVGGPDLANGRLEDLPPGLVCDHIRDLALKARTQGGGKLDQTLLLRSLADKLRGSNGFGAFASDTLMKLGLLGTIIGFIIMLAPIAGLDASDRALMKSSMGLMSGGMAVAMYTTLAGLVGSILLKFQYYMLDAATAKVFSRAVALTETRVVPELERARCGMTSAFTRARSPSTRSASCCSRRCRSSPSCSSSPCSRSRRKRRRARSNSKAEFLITMDWPDNHPDDLDLFVQDPAGNVAWYRHREAGFLVLDRDDRGGANDFIVVNGKKISSPIREEIVTIRGIVPGEYTVNVSHFLATTREPVPASVKVQKLNPTAQVVFDDQVFVDHTGDEKTAVRFTIDAEGKVTDVNRRQKSLMETFRAVARNGSDLDPKTRTRTR